MTKTPNFHPLMQRQKKCGIIIMCGDQTSRLQVIKQTDRCTLAEGQVITVLRLTAVPLTVLTRWVGRRAGVRTGALASP